MIYAFAENRANATAALRRNEVVTALTSGGGDNRISPLASGRLRETREIMEDVVAREALEDASEEDMADLEASFRDTDKGSGREGGIETETETNSHIEKQQG